MTMRRTGALFLSFLAVLLLKSASVSAECTYICPSPPYSSAWVLHCGDPWFGGESTCTMYTESLTCEYYDPYDHTNHFDQFSCEACEAASQSPATIHNPHCVSASTPQ
jgi:hypothetical protein